MEAHLPLVEAVVVPEGLIERGDEEAAEAQGIGRHEDHRLIG